MDSEGWVYGLRVCVVLEEIVGLGIVVLGSYGSSAVVSGSGIFD